MDLQSQFNDLKRKQQNGSLQQLSPLNANQSSSDNVSDLDDLNDLLNLTDEAHFDSGILQSDAFKLRSLTPKIERIPRFSTSKVQEQKHQQYPTQSQQNSDQTQGALTFWDQEKAESEVGGLSDIQSNDFMSQFSFDVDSVADLSKNSATSFTANFGMAVADSLLQAGRQPQKTASESGEPARDLQATKQSKRADKSSKHPPPQTIANQSPSKKAVAKPKNAPKSDNKRAKSATDRTRVFANNSLYIWEDIWAARKQIREESQSCLENHKKTGRTVLQKRGLESLMAEQTYMLVQFSNSEKRHFLYPELPSRIIQPLYLRYFLGEGYHKPKVPQPGVLSLIILGDGFHDGALLMLEQRGVQITITAHEKQPAFRLSD